MAVTDSENIKLGLKLAVASLLTPIATAKADGKQNSKPSTLESIKAELKKTDVETGFLFYQEKDRVRAIEYSLSLGREFENGSSLSLKGTTDTLTGASHNGATQSDEYQTFTNPSGEGTYTIAPGETPLDPTFQDRRNAATMSWSQPTWEDQNWTFGGSFSEEHDFTSLTLFTSYGIDFNQKNTNLSIGYAYEKDEISATGGIPIGLERMKLPGQSQNKKSGKPARDTHDILISVTQVLTVKSLVQFSYSRSQSSGYHSDPYKIVSIIEADDPERLGKTNYYIYESRPEDRLRQSLFLQGKYHLTKDVVSASYRYYWDDWGVKSNTIELNYDYELFPNHSFVPHLRYYSQHEADFYMHSLPENSNLMEFVSADYRLATFDAMTYGLKYSYSWEANKYISLNLESYEQNGESKPSDAIGVQKKYDLFPKVEAIMTQFIVKF